MTKSETTARFWLPEMDRLMLFLLLSHGNLALTCALQKADGILALAMYVVCPASLFRMTSALTYSPSTQDTRLWHDSHISNLPQSSVQ